MSRTGPSARTAFAAAGVLLLVGSGACARHPRETDDEAAAAPEARVRLAVATERIFRPTVSAPGQWRASGELTVTAPFPAFVESLRVEVGDVVSRGAVLAVLTTRESRAALLGAEQLRAAATDDAARAEAERAIAAARRALVRLPLTAGAAGVVTRRAVSAGAEVGEGTELLALVPEQGLVFEAHVPLRDAAAVRPGQRAVVSAEDGSRVAATVRRRLPQTAAGEQTALVWLAPERPAPVAWRDRFASVAIGVGAPHRALAVPDSALVEDDLTGVTRVARLDPGGFAIWTPVRLGAGDGGWHELIAPPFGAGTRVLVEGQRGLPDRTRVTVAP